MAVKPQLAVEQLAEQLSEGFAALTSEYKVLFDHQRQLESKLSWAKQQYLDLLKKFTPSSLSQDHLAFLQDLENVGNETARPLTEWIDGLSQSEDADKRTRAHLIRQAATATTALPNSRENDGVKIWSGPSADRDISTTLRVNTEDPMEKDFTTSGTPSKLGCPFASGRQSPLATPRSSTSRMSLRGRRSKRPSFTDPIRAEICGNDPRSDSPSIEGSAGVCPIRFLDQHAPEEVAKYFENHKHEIPRSHEVCIKRFQSNAEGIRQLDRKYGNLVNMIQGLGQKHQAWLPKDPDDDAEGLADEAEPDEKVKNWAKAVTASLQDFVQADDVESPEHAPDPDEGRTAHFDRPLKEIRVGESPSRPWGISIPAKYQKAESVVSAPTASPPMPQKMEHTDAPADKPNKCPFDHRAFGANAKAKGTENPHIPEHPPKSEGGVRETSFPAQQDKPYADRGSTNPYPQLVFNGPVFFGYPPDQLASFLQHTNLGGGPK